MREALEAALDDLSDEVAEVRIGILEKDEELLAEEPYHVAIYFVVDEDVWNEGVELRQQINSSFNKFVAELDACDGVEVDQELSEVSPGSKFSWQDMKLTDLWDFANLSHRD